MREHYRELGRVGADYARLPRLVHAPRERVFARWEGEEHAHAARARGRGVVFLTGHLGHFELYGAAMGRVMPMAILVKPLSNPGAEAWLRSLRNASGVELLPTGAGVRGAGRGRPSSGRLSMRRERDGPHGGRLV